MQVNVWWPRFPINMNNQNYNRNYNHYGYDDYDYTSWYNYSGGGFQANRNPTRGRGRPKSHMGNSKRFENKTRTTRIQNAPSQGLLNLEPKQKSEDSISHLKQNLKNPGVEGDQDPKMFENNNEDPGFQSAPNQDNFNLEHEQKLGVECSQVEANHKDQESKEDDAKSKASGIPNAAPNQDILKLEHKQKLEDKCAQLEENLKNQGLKVICFIFIMYSSYQSHSQIMTFYFRLLMLS